MVVELSCLLAVLNSSTFSISISISVLSDIPVEQQQRSKSHQREIVGLNACIIREIIATAIFMTLMVKVKKAYVCKMKSFAVCRMKSFVCLQKRK